MTDDMKLKEFDELKALLAVKYAKLKALEKEVLFLKKTFTSVLQFRDENDWAGKTEHATFKMQEGFKLSYPGNSDLEKKREFYTFMQKKDKPWYQQSVMLNWNAVNAYANAEIDAMATKKKEWKPWPHCERAEELKFDMRTRPGAIKKLYDPRVLKLGFEG